MDFKQPEIRTEYQEELNSILERVREQLGEDAAELFVYFVSAFSTAGGRADTAAQRLFDLCIQHSIELKFCRDTQRFNFINKSGKVEYLHPYGQNRSKLIPFIIESVLVAHRAMKTIPRGDNFENAIRVVQEAYSNLLEL